MVLLATGPLKNYEHVLLPQSQIYHEHYMCPRCTKIFPTHADNMQTLSAALKHRKRKLKLEAIEEREEQSKNVDVDMLRI